MKLCPLGHGNPDDASRCEVCLARFTVLPLVRELEGVPDVPLPVHAGEEDWLVLRVLQAGGVGAECTVSVVGEAAPWVAPVRRELVIGPGETADVRVRIHPPPETAPGLWSAALRVEGGSQEPSLGADLILRVLEPGDATPVVTPPPPPPVPVSSEAPPPPVSASGPPSPAEPPTEPMPVSPGQHAPCAWLGLPDDCVPLFEGEVVLGRDPNVDIVVYDPATSRRHVALRVVLDGGGMLATVHDLGSTNGTYVNGERVVDAPLTVGDRLTLGRTELGLLGE